MEEPDGGAYGPGAGSETVGTGGKRRRGIKIYRAKDGVDTALTGFRGAFWASPETGERLRQLHEAGHLSGLTSTTLFRQSAEEGGFSALLLWAKPNYPLPPHSHRSDCMYFVLSGSATMGSVTLRAGDAFFVPNGVRYQYRAGAAGAEVLEVRHGVEEIGIDMSDASPGVYQRCLEATLENRDRWAELVVSPIMQANQSEET
jgi:mannose-6-phosphate isomerase-like protein (cupin superfamily)